MKVTLIGINFYPEDTAIGLYSTQIAEKLYEKGFEIDVITGYPYYPQWKIWNRYKEKPRFLKEEYNGIQIYRYKQYVPQVPTFIKRIIHLIDFSLGSLINVMKIKKTDAIIVVVPFTTSIALGWLLKKRTKSKLWVHVQDFEFDAAFQTGVATKNPSKLRRSLYKLLFRIEKYLYSKVDIASSISYSMLEKLKLKTNVKPIYLPNWIDTNKINPKNTEVHPYLISKRFKILYSGNIGDKQDWETYLSFIKALDENKFEIIIVGDGAKRDWLIRCLNDCKNVKLYPPVPYEELSSLLCSADLHVLFQKTEVVDTVMPSKLLGMMASGRPSLITGSSNSEVKKVLSESKGGRYYTNDNIDVMLDFVNDLVRNKELGLEMGDSARNFVIQRFSKDEVLDAFVQNLEESINRQ